MISGLFRPILARLAHRHRGWHEYIWRDRLSVSRQCHDIGERPMDSSWVRYRGDMRLTVRASDLDGRPVVTLDTATEAAKIADVVIDPANGDVVGFRLRSQGILGLGGPGSLPLDAVRAVGSGAVMITAETGLVREGAMVSGLGAAKDIRGDRVINENGAVTGHVTDVILAIDGATIDVIGYEIEQTDGTRALIALPDTFVISQDALIVSNSTKHLPPDDLEAVATSAARQRSSGTA